MQGIEEFHILNKMFKVLEIYFMEALNLDYSLPTIVLQIGTLEG
jgi:hypothetical protein